MRAHSADAVGSIPDEREATAKAILAAELKGEKDMHPANRRRAVRARASKARNFPTNTSMFEDEPLHSAGSLYAAIAALWEAQTRIAVLEATTAAETGSVGIAAGDAPTLPPKQLNKKRQPGRGSRDRRDHHRL